MSLNHAVQTTIWRNARWLLRLTALTIYAIYLDPILYSTFRSFRFSLTFVIFQSIVKLLFFSIIITEISACNSTPNIARPFVIELATEIRHLICPIGSQGGKPCGDKDVRSEADWGNVGYIYIYGVTDEKKINFLIEFVTNFKDKYNRRIPIEITFYSNLSRSKKIKQINLKGEK